MHVKSLSKFGHQYQESYGHPTIYRSHRMKNVTSFPKKYLHVNTSPSLKDIPTHDQDYSYFKADTGPLSGIKKQL